MSHFCKWLLKFLLTVLGVLQLSSPCQRPLSHISYTTYSYVLLLWTKGQGFILKQFQKSKIFELLYYGIPYMYGCLVATVRFYTSLIIWISHATFKFVSKKFYNATASAFLLYTTSMLRFIPCTSLYCTYLAY